MHQFGSGKSPLQKKLTLFFILVTVVSLSVSLQMILEFSTPTFSNKIKDKVVAELQQGFSEEDIKKVDIEKINSAIYDPIGEFRTRMIFVLLVICAGIFVAFKMFANDIVEPMENIVEATQKIADGDLTITVPVMSDDEIGQVAKLINDMNDNLQSLIVQVKQAIEAHKDKIQQAMDTVALMTIKDSEDIIEKKEMKLSDFKKMLKLNQDVVKLNDTMMIQIDSLETFLNMYKTYKIDGTVDINQSELDKVLEQVNPKA